MHKALHSRLHGTKTEGRGLTGIEDCVNETIQRLKEYTKKKSKEQE